MNESEPSIEGVTIPTFTSAEYREFILRSDPNSQYIESDEIRIKWRETFQARFSEWLNKREIPKNAGQITVAIDGRYFLMQTEDEDFGTITEIDKPRL